MIEHPLFHIQNYSDLANQHGGRKFLGTRMCMVTDDGSRYYLHPRNYVVEFPEEPCRKDLRTWEREFCALILKTQPWHLRSLSEGVFSEAFFPMPTFTPERIGSDMSLGLCQEANRITLRTLRGIRKHAIVSQRMFELMLQSPTLPFEPKPRKTAASIFQYQGVLHAKMDLWTCREWTDYSPAILSENERSGIHDCPALLGIMNGETCMILNEGDHRNTWKTMTWVMEYGSSHLERR